jgi:cholest-4-en-3-one 26-monooxygenase
MNLADIDLYDPETYLRGGIPHDWLKALRHEAPVYWHKEPNNGPGFWALTRYKDIAYVSEHPLLFSSARGGTNIQDYPAEEMNTIRILMVNMDPPQHMKFRKIVRQGFTPRMVSYLEPRMRESARQMLAQVAHKGSCDFVAEIASRLPLYMIAELMGIPEDDRDRIYTLSNRLIGFDDPEFQTSLEDGKIAAMEMWMYANQLAESRKGKAGEDLVSILTNAEVDGQKLTEMEFDGFFLLLAVAGNETTRNLISGGMLALMEHPDQRTRLLADPSLIESGVEEMLRWVTPVINFRRTAMADTEIRGQKIREGQKVVMFYPSANRDEEVFPDPYRFDVGRSPNDHLSFGIGEHFCLGSSLARLEIRILFEELLARLPDIRLAGPIRRLRSNLVSGVKSMPVEYTPA